MPRRKWAISGGTAENRKTSLTKGGEGKGNSPERKGKRFAKGKKRLGGQKLKKGLRGIDRF